MRALARLLYKQDLIHEFGIFRYQSDVRLSVAIVRKAAVISKHARIEPDFFESPRVKQLVVTRFHA